METNQVNGLLESFYADFKEDPILAVVEVLCSIHGRECDKPLLIGWYLELKMLDSEQIAYGLKRTLSEHPKFMPTPAQFLEMATTEPGQSIESEAELSWVELQRAIQRYGYMSSVYFKNAVIAETVRSFGGWKAVCGWMVDELPYRKMDFVGRYQSYRRSKVDFDPFLIGAADSNPKNRENIAIGKSKPHLGFVGTWDSDKKLQIEQEVISQFQGQRKMLQALSGETDKRVQIESSQPKEEWNASKVLSMLSSKVVTHEAKEMVCSA